MADKKVEKVEFIQYHRPALEAGDYQITVTQKVESGKIPADEKKEFPTTRHFTVAGERFALKPADIHAVFPPAGSLGDHSNVLPHIVFNRSTLPWEREVEANSPDVPWLALLLFEEGEKPTPQILTLGELGNNSGSKARFPSFSLESGQHDDDKVTIIDVKKGLLQRIMPTKEDLAYLAHVRQATDDSGPVRDELAVVIGNRLPKRGGTSTVHLVSVEGRYKDGGFDYQGAGDDDLIRLVSLKSWRFACLDEKQSFKGSLIHLNREPSILRPPRSDQAEAEKYLAMGYVPVPHHLRQGSRTVSWYHGPLTTGENPSDIVLPVRAADELVRYNPANGMFDVSYAAAWELGRLLALQSKQFSISLYNWKRTHAQQLAQAEQKLIHPHLPAYGQQAKTTSNALEIPKGIADWFWRLSLMQGVPFNYLVPDERMLPKESIRFFMVDPLWVDCLLDGAFSIGRVTGADHERDSSHVNSPAANRHETVSGLLLRSDVVAGWPGLLVDAYDITPPTADPTQELPPTNGLELLRMDRLSANVLICLFDGEVKTVDIHQKPETLHFGLDERDDATGYEKKLRDSKGNQDGQVILAEDFRWRDEARRVINISQLADLGNMRTSAQFALRMIEGVEKVTFIAAA